LHHIVIRYSQGRIKAVAREAIAQGARFQKAQKGTILNSKIINLMIETH
jgi:hypothetical protein